MKKLILLAIVLTGVVLVGCGDKTDPNDPALKPKAAGDTNTRPDATGASSTEAKL